MQSLLWHVHAAGRGGATHTTTTTTPQATRFVLFRSVSFRFVLLPNAGESSDTPLLSPTGRFFVVGLLRPGGGGLIGSNSLWVARATVHRVVPFYSIPFHHTTPHHTTP